MATCYSADMAIEVIQEYLNLQPVFVYGAEDELAEKSMSIPNNSILKDGKVKGG